VFRTTACILNVEQYVALSIHVGEGSLFLTTWNYPVDYPEYYISIYN